MRSLSVSLLVPMLDAVPEPEDVKPGWIAAVTMIALFVATFLLWMNMRKQLRRIRFDEPESGPDSTGPDSTGPDSGERTGERATGPNSAPRRDEGTNGAR